MSKNYFIQCILVLTIFFGCNSVAVELQWNELPPLPNPDGVAGPVIGVHNDALIVGGGANQYLGGHYGEVIWAQYSSNGNIRHRYYDNDGIKNDINFYGKLNYNLKPNQVLI